MCLPEEPGAWNLLWTVARCGTKFLVHSPQSRMMPSWLGPGIPILWVPWNHLNSTQDGGLLLVPIFSNSFFPGESIQTSVFGLKTPDSWGKIWFWDLCTHKVLGIFVAKWSASVKLGLKWVCFNLLHLLVSWVHSGGMYKIYLSSVVPLGVVKASGKPCPRHTYILSNLPRSSKAYTGRYVPKGFLSVLGPL